VNTFNDLATVVVFNEAKQAKQANSKRGVEEPSETLVVETARMSFEVSPSGLCVATLCHQRCIPG
jgi:hypothetical protein